MTARERAVAYAVREPVKRVALAEVLRRGSGEILLAGEDGVLVRDTVSGTWMLSARDRTALDRALAVLPGDTDLVYGHELWYKDKLKARFGLKTEQVCFLSVWTGERPPEPPPFSGELRLLDRSWAPWLHEHYSHSFGGVEYMEGAVERGAVGAFLDGACAGFVSVHDEGSIGMLEVLPAYRRRGVGAALLATGVTLALDRGRYAYGQVIEDNAASLALQRKLGMTISADRVFWAF